jgi:hypothetical protein
MVIFHSFWYVYQRVLATLAVFWRSQTPITSNIIPILFVYAINYPNNQQLSGSQFSQAIFDGQISTYGFHPSESVLMAMSQNFGWFLQDLILKYLKSYNVGPPSCKLVYKVYKPHEYYSYKIHIV